MQHVTQLSFLLLAYSNYLSLGDGWVSCGSSSASPAQLRHVAKRQVDYILGNNPLRMSYMVGYGARFPRRIHHRASSLLTVAAHSAWIVWRVQGQRRLLRHQDAQPKLARRRRRGRAQPRLRRVPGRARRVPAVGAHHIHQRAAHGERGRRGDGRKKKIRAFWSINFKKHIE